MNAGGQGDKVIVGNGVNVGSYYPSLFNGAMREVFPYLHGSLDPSPNPYGYHWRDNMFNPNYGYLATESAMRQPNFSLIAAHPLNAGGNPLQPSIDSNFERHFRFSFGSTLLGNGYFGISNWSSAWWFNNYYIFNNQKNYLGSPQGNYVKIFVETRQGSDYGVYERSFANGRVIVNASGYAQSVTLSSYYYQVQDSSLLNGTVQIQPWDALILVNAPPPTCTPQWNCSSWSSCVSGIQTRTCTDQNNCGTNEGKPPESQSCSSPGGSYVLTVSKTGGGSGDIVSGDGGINCGSDCSESYSAGAPVVLTANPAANSIFAGWSADCFGGGSSPASGNVPLGGVDLTANVSGSASGNINYTFYCNRSDEGVNITSPYAIKIDGRSETSYSAADICSYETAGAYSVKVIVERGTALPAEARAVVNVTVSPSTPPPKPPSKPPPSPPPPVSYLPLSPTSSYVPPIPQEVTEVLSRVKTSLRDLSHFLAAVVVLILVIALFY